MEKPSGLTRCSVEPVARQSRPMLPVFGGISGSTRTTLNMVDRALRRASLTLSPPLSHHSRSSAERSIHLQLARDEFLQLHDIRREFPDALTGLFVSHRVIIEKVAELLFVQLQPLDV